ncbi:DUF2721 domain-containing protein [Martelella mediterranea]|uniref:DUF2721 domain-containing protein n=2 Tax=Martelella TaxID=293088 RepID=A0A1U9YZK7_9HYPH|nr:DUF2721 domain-containing protein [Martelella mediterranea]AQZ50883.1 hypothetical protein Mame_01532 [Martelella mediterranea DSM 17316]
MNEQPIVSDLVAIVQTSLAPVFLLAGTAGFVSIYTIRLGRVSDRLNEIADSGRALREQDPDLRLRALTLVVAMILGAVAAICTGSAILNLLAGALEIGLREENLLWLFGGAIVSLIASLVAFLFELLVCARTMLRQLRMDRMHR